MPERRGLPKDVDARKGSGSCHRGCPPGFVSSEWGSGLNCQACLRCSVLAPTPIPPSVWKMPLLEEFEGFSGDSRNGPECGRGSHHRIWYLFTVLFQLSLEASAGWTVRPMSPHPVSPGCGVSSIIWEGNGCLAAENVQCVFLRVRQLFRETPRSSWEPRVWSEQLPAFAPSCVWMPPLTKARRRPAWHVPWLRDTPVGWAGCQTLPQP